MKEPRVELNQLGMLRHELRRIKSALQAGNQTKSASFSFK
jgi:hypothetical protein